MTIYDVRDALLSVTDRAYHYKAPRTVVDSGDSYAVWGETGITSLPADDGPAEWALSGMVYFYTPEEYDPLFDDICRALAEAGVAVRPGRIGYDESRSETSYELVWEIPAAPFALYADPEG